MAPASGFAFCAYACALLLFTATANCTVTYYSVAYSSDSGHTLFTATLNDNGNVVCALSEVQWAGPEHTMDLDCGSSGYTATADFSQADYNGYIQQEVTITRPGFTGSFGAPECMYNCGCGSDDCVTWTGSSW